MRLASLPLLASLVVAPGCLGVLVVPPTAGFIGGVAVGSSSSKKHDSGTSYGLVGAAIGVAVDVVLIVVAVSAINGAFETGD
jgi:hypothetical protein